MDLIRNSCVVSIPLSIRIDRDIRIYYGEDYYVLNDSNKDNNTLLINIINETMKRLNNGLKVKCEL